MFRRVLRGSVLSAVVAAMIGILAASPALAYGPANWQVAFSGTGTQPTVGGFGFWGWCDFAGGTTFNGAGEATAGTAGDCEYAEYFHQPTVFGATCHESLDLRSWYIGPNG